MTFAVIKNRTVVGFVVNTDRAEAEQTLVIHGHDGVLCPVSLTTQFPSMFQSCIFGPTAAQMTIWSKIKLWFRGVSVQKERFTDAE